MDDDFDPVKALNGRHLQVTAEGWKPWVNIEENPDGTKTFTGISIDVFNILAKHYNFTFSVRQPPDHTWGTPLENGSFTGMVGLCQRGEVDMALGPFSPNQDRYQVVEFSSTIYVEFFGIIMPRPTIQRDLASFLKPLAPNVWTTLLVMMILLFILATVIQYYSERKMRPFFYKDPKPGTIMPSGKVFEKPHYEDQVETLFFNWEWIPQTMTAESIPLEPVRDSGRILLVTLLVGGWLLSAAYAGVLTSLIAVPKVEIPVDSMQELVDYGKIPWACEFGTAMHNDFKTVDSPLFKAVNKELRTVRDCFGARKEIAEGLAVFCDYLAMQKIIGTEFSALGECGYYIAAKPTHYSELVMIFPKGSPLREPLSSKITALREAGLVMRMIDAATPNTSACMVKPGDEGGSGIIIFGMGDMGGLFLVLVGGWIISAIVYFGELIYKQCRLRKNTGTPFGGDRNMSIDTSRGRVKDASEEVVKSVTGGVDIKDQHEPVKSSILEDMRRRF